MSSSSRRDKKRGKGDELSLDNHSEGTAARTRPLSFDEIMFRREHKKLSESSKKDAREDGGLSGGVSVEKFSEYNKSKRNHSRNKNSSSVSEKHLSSEFVKVNTRKKEDSTHATDGGSARQKDRDIRQSDARYKGEDTGISKQRKDRESEIRSKDGSQAEDDREYYESETKYKDDRPAYSKHRILMSEIRLKDGSLPKQRERGSGGPETHLKAEMKKENLSKNEGKAHKHSFSHGLILERLNGDSEDKATQKHSRDSTRKDRHVDRIAEKSEKESKKKYRNADDEKDRGKSSGRNHDPGKGRGFEISERMDRKDPRPHDEEPKLKRRRSRSREREDRTRRSISRSPGAHKRTSYHEREHEEMVAQSVKDRSKRQQSDIDRSKVTSNGSSSHYRRHGGSMSGLGGYSPRKRKTEAAAKTPSPINRSPEKKSAKWDVAPEVANNSSSSSVPSKFQLLNQTDEIVRSLPDSSTASKLLTDISVGAFLAKQNVANDSVQLTQATRPMRSLIVENLPGSASDKEVMEFINKFLLSSGVNKVQGSLPCISCNIQKDKGQAIIEFLTPEDASAALACDGISFSGSVFKVRRPKDFVQVASGEKEKSVAAVDSVSDVVKDSPHKIFVGCISRAISSKMFMDIASAFGPLKAYHFEDSEDQDRDLPCAFLEYVDQAITSRACAGLNGMKLAGNILTAVQAVPNGSTWENSRNPPFYGIPAHALPLLEKSTQVIKLKNVFNPEGLSSLSEVEVGEVLEDVRLECARFGTVRSVNVVNYMDSHITTLNECGVDDDTTAKAGQNLEYEQTNKNEEICEEAIDRQSKKSIGSDSPSEANEVKEVDMVDEGEGINDDKPADDLLEDQPLLQEVDNNIDVKDQALESISEPTSGEDSQQPNPVEDKCDNAEAAGNNQTDDTSLEKETLAEEQFKAYETNGNTEEASAEMDNIKVMQPEAAENVTENSDSKKQDYDQGLVFETGCVYVEFRRAEAACMAAHCLHGRPFDDRVVSVEYVPLDLYKARFPK